MATLPRALPAALAVLLLVTAGCLGTSVAAQSNGEPDDSRTIDVAATGIATADPDLAIVRVAVEARADSADGARAEVAEDTDRMREALRDLGVHDDDVRTTSFHVGPEYDYTSTRDGRELIGYRAVHAFEVESDVDGAGRVIDVAVENGASRVDGVQFTLTPETRQALREEALTEAMGHARADAEAIAGASGVSLGTLHSASTGSVGFIPYDRAVAESAGGDGASTTVEPGPVRVTATVEAAYEIR